MLEHFRFLQRLVKPEDGVAKISIPGPSARNFRMAPENIDYPPDRDGLLPVSVIATSFKASDRTYGARWVWHDVLEEGLICGLHRLSG